MSESKPVWATGPEQITVELLFGKTYDIDVDIAKRMNIIHEARTSKEMVTVTACSTKDFEDALTFCANDRTCSQPPTKTLERIMSEMDPTSPTPALTTREPRVVDDEEEEDETYEPSSDSSASDSGNEYSDVDPADLGTEELKAEREAHGETAEPPSLSKEERVAQRLAKLKLTNDQGGESDPEDESYAPSSDSSASDSGDEYSDVDPADVGTAAIKAERDEFKAKQDGEQVAAVDA
ncbi:hypothetical protein FRC12_021464 [Ceratobasidium sp. 428]|nr:hypothetical protein FRC12_021464 [Ceratobasidium sp. 428]